MGAGQKKINKDSFAKQYSWVPVEKFEADIKLKTRLVFSRFLNLHGSLENVKEKPTRKTCFFREKKRLAPHIHLAKAC